MSAPRVRFAPSPTGYLHVGGARTALYNYLYAKKRGGTFILRIEDTDLERSTEEAMRMQIGDLQWLGLLWDEGPDASTLKDKGPHGPYRQSQRTQIYMEQANKLLASGHAYYDFRTDEELEKLKAGDGSGEGVHHIPRPATFVSVEEARKRLAAGEKAAIRFKIKDSKEYVFNDLVRGEVRLPSDMVSDFVLMRSNGMPVYNFCCVVDDALMKITHVFRAEEHLSNTVRQMMIYEALGMPVPQFGHMSFILGPDRQKLSKRHGATSCHDFHMRGYLPEAILNYIALLGWSSPNENQEIMSVKEMAELFDYDRLVPSPAVFDEEKLNWVNATHLRALPTNDLWARIKPFLAKEGIHVPEESEWVEKALHLFKPRMTTLVDAVNLFRPLSDAAYKVGDESKEVLAWAETPKVWDAWEAGLKAHATEFLTEPDFNALQDKVKDAAGVKGKHLFMPIRVAVIGKPSGAELKELVPLLPKASLLKRVQQARAART